MAWYLLLVPLILLGGVVLVMGRSFYSGGRGAGQGQWGGGRGMGGGGISPPMLLVGALVLFVLLLLAVAFAIGAG